jgi:hypothetical protein
MPELTDAEISAIFDKGNARIARIIDLLGSDMPDPTSPQGIRMGEAVKLLGLCGMAPLMNDPDNDMLTSAREQLVGVWTRMLQDWDLPVFTQIAILLEVNGALERTADD